MNKQNKQTGSTDNSMVVTREGGWGQFKESQIYGDGED